MKPQLFCAHRHEVASTLPSGKRGLYCLSCGRTRPHPWAATAKDERRWKQKRKEQPVGPAKMRRIK